MGQKKQKKEMMQGDGVDYASAAIQAPVDDVLEAEIQVTYPAYNGF